MFLKSLVLRGFKTFADKTVLEFDPSGITAIVGPNGCGKSNTVDAFRFILGEGSFNELRVKNLSDVIFAGTQERKQLSLAEVALVLDNGDQSLPIEFDEVSIRRRSFRDGTSEFLINNNSCRLKDIRDLFVDAGISEDSLSIIGQGKVDSILSSQPEERRAVFEEVAGIRKYKQRKNEAERKLILAEQNLLRISDLKNEIGENLGVLEEQSKAASEYVGLKTRLRDLDLGITQRQIQTILEKGSILREEISKFQKSKEEQDKKEKILEAEKHLLKEAVKDLDIELENAFNDLEDLKEKIENERSNLIIEQQRIFFEEKNKLRDLKETERFLAFEIKQIEQNQCNLENKVKDLKTKTERIQTDDLNILPELKSFLVNSEKLISISKQLILSIHQKEIDDQSTNNKLTEIFTEEIKDIERQKRTELETLENKSLELGEISTKVAELSKQIFALEEEGKNIIQNLNKKPGFLKLQEEHTKLQEKISGIKKGKEEKSSQLEFLESRGENREDVSQKEAFFKNELMLAKTEGELAQISERLQAEYNLTVCDLQKEECSVANIGAAKKESSIVRSRMLALEPVNLLAIEEFKHSQERFKLISEQYEDLNSARENLTRLINELDLKAKEEFLKKMDIIAAHFKQIFSELFVGGEAKLELCLHENNNPLEAGIEISTCPSGRKWLPLQSLSGGERALTAIAILFAFLKTNPSPFCILDEVDAPLDDANIDRFTKYLKEISSITQILIITHNKHTMKVADTLYGITMEEAGVSRVISMKMNKVAKASAA
ncbi:MAG: AAA family ATPase [Candidatus Saganbacteria bacterium]|nr:AAA family ATPase [Candidatus Saganbacteria bacterium]